MIADIQGTAGTPVVLKGYANDFDKTIAGLEFSLDDGCTWTFRATPGITAERNLYWEFSYTPECPGRYDLLVRSVNEDGTRSPQPAHVGIWVR